MRHEIQNYIYAVKALADALRKKGYCSSADSLLAGMDIELSDNCGYVKCEKCKEYHNTCKALCRECEGGEAVSEFRAYNAKADYYDM